MEHPQSEARQLFPEIDHPTAGRCRVTGSPIKLSETPGMHGEPAPLLGQHTADVLKQMLGLDECAIESLVERGVVFETEPNTGAA